MRTIRLYYYHSHYEGLFNPATVLEHPEAPCDKQKWRIIVMSLTDIERGDESCKMTFSDGTKYHVEYLDLRLDCPCANCKPRRENKQRMIEFKEELSRLRIEKPSIEIVGHYGLKFIWPSGCSSGIYSFDILREIAEKEPLYRWQQS